MSANRHSLALCASILTKLPSLLCVKSPFHEHTPKVELLWERGIQERRLVIPRQDMMWIEEGTSTVWALFHTCFCAARRQSQWGRVLLLVELVRDGVSSQCSADEGCSSCTSSTMRVPRIRQS